MKSAPTFCGPRFEPFLHRLHYTSDPEIVYMTTEDECLAWDPNIERWVKDQAPDPAALRQAPSLLLYALNKGLTDALREYFS